MDAKMKPLITLLFIFCGMQLFAEETSGSVVYFQRHEIGVKIKKFDPPVQVEWYQIDSSAPTRLKEQIQMMQTESFFAHDNFESWYNSREKRCTGNWKRSSASKDFYRDSFKRNHTSLDEFKKKYPQLRYSSVIYTIEYTLSTNEYVDVVYVSGAEALKAYPKNLVELKETHRLGAKFLKNENGVWKSDIKPTYLQQLTKLWDDLPHLRSLLDTHTYHSITEAGLAPFDPPERLKMDSIRERYDGETLFRYPEPDARLAELRTLVEHHQDAIHSLALKLTALYALIVTYLWRRRRA
jgi:hypothetical protein